MQQNFRLSTDPKYWSWKLFALLLTLLWIGFVFANSMQDGAASSLRSDQVIKAVEETLQKVGVEANITSFFVRKMAHFLEYLVLGIGLMSVTYLFSGRFGIMLFVPLFFGLLVPMADESIQMFYDGRGPQLTDVWLDFSGVITGITLTAFVIASFRALYRRRRAHRKNR